MSLSYARVPFILVSLALLAILQTSSAAWVQQQHQKPLFLPSASSSSRQHALLPIVRQWEDVIWRQPTSTALLERSDGNDGGSTTSSSSSSGTGTTLRRARARFAGVSVSSTSSNDDDDDNDVGFWIMLQIGPDEYVPVQVTDDPMDASAATSSQALTILQLLARVDMAGPILPPDVLSRMLVSTACGDDDDEEDDESPESSNSGHSEVSSSQSMIMDLVSGAVLDQIKESIQTAIALRFPDRPEKLNYGELNPWMRSRIPLPQCTLDEVLMQVNPAKPNISDFQFTLKCSVKEMGTVAFTLDKETVLEQVCYYYRPTVSASFTVLALALRYQAPVVVTLFKNTNDNDPDEENVSSCLFSLEQLQSRFPMFKTTNQLRETSDRAAQTIERGFEVNKLQAALRIALQKEDFKAAERIRTALDQLDSMKDLPVQPESDMDSMQ